MKKYWKCQELPLPTFFVALELIFDKETFCKRWYISSKKIRRCHVQLSRHFLSIYFWHNTSSFSTRKIFRKFLSLGTSFQFFCWITKLFKNPGLTKMVVHFLEFCKYQSQMSRHLLSLNFWHNTSSFLITKLFAKNCTYPRKKIRKCLSLGASFQFFCRITKFFKNPVLTKMVLHFLEFRKYQGQMSWHFLSLGFFWRYT